MRKNKLLLYSSLSLFLLLVACSRAEIRDAEENQSQVLMVTNSQPEDDAEANVYEEVQAVEEESRTFRIGMDHHELPETAEAYIERLAYQIAIYNEIAPQLWVQDNPAVNMSVLVGDSSSREKFWYINPTGEVTNLSLEEVIKRHPSMDFSESGMFWFQGYGLLFSPEDDNGNGFYTFLDFEGDAEILDIKRRQEQIGRGDINHMSTLLHGAVHSQMPYFHFVRESENTPPRNNRELDTGARLMRRLINTQILDALENQENVNYVLNLLSTFVHYRENFAEDYTITSFLDTTEGIAQWYDWVGTMMAVYHEQIQTREDVHAAFGYMARYHRENTWLTRSFGAVHESYIIGSLTTVLLDIHMRREEWQFQIRTTDSHPLDLLLERFGEENLSPFDHVFSEKEQEELLELRSELISHWGIDITDLAYLLATTFDLNMPNREEINTILASNEMLIDDVISIWGEDWYNHEVIVIDRNLSLYLVARLLNISIEDLDFMSKEPNESIIGVDFLTFGEAFYLVERLKDVLN